MCARCDEQTGRSKAALDPAIRAVLRPLAEAGLTTPDPWTVPIAEARAVNERYFRAIAEPRAAVARVEEVEAAAQDGHRVPVKVAIPLDMPSAAPGMLYCHGGGYAFGDLDTHDAMIRALADVFAMPVFAVHYRRTPEHAWPAPLEDALGAIAAMRGADWAARFGHDPARLVAFGDSAGAHLALAAMLALRARGLPQLAGAGLAYGMYARRFDTWSHHAYGDGSLGLSSARMRWFWDRLLGEAPGANNPIAEPLDADLAGLPPLALAAAEVDCLLDDTLDLVEACKRQGHRHSFDLVRGAPHGFLHLTSRYAPARETLEKLAQRMQRLSAAP